MVYYKNYTYCNPLIHRALHVQVAENQNVLKKHVGYV